MRMLHAVTRLIALLAFAVLCGFAGAEGPGNEVAPAEGRTADGAAAAAVADGDAAAETLYRIVLHRPAAAGYRYRNSVAVDIETERSVVEGAGARQQVLNSVRLHLESTASVIEVDAAGRPTAESHEIITCTFTEGDTVSQVLEQGVTVTARAEVQGAVFTVNGAPASAQQAEFLNQVIKLSSAESTDDDVFGTPHQRRVGESWPVNAKAMLRDLATRGMSVTEADITGEVKLIGVSRIDGVECLNLEGHVLISNLPAPEGMPSSLRMTAGTMDIRLIGTWPIEATLQRLSQSLAVSATMRLSPTMPGAPAMTMETVQRTIMTGRFRPAGGAAR